MEQRKSIYRRLDELLIILRDDFKGDWVNISLELVEKAVQANIENNASGIETLLKRLEMDNNVHFNIPKTMVQINEGGKDLLNEGGYVKVNKNQVEILKNSRTQIRQNIAIIILTIITVIVSAIALLKEFSH